MSEVSAETHLSVSAISFISENGESHNHPLKAAGLDGACLASWLSSLSLSPHGGVSSGAFHHLPGSDEGPDFELINKEVFGGWQEIIIECFAPLAPSTDQVSAKPETEVTPVKDKCESVIHNEPLMAWRSAQTRTIFHRVFEMLEHAVVMSDSPSSTKC